MNVDGECRGIIGVGGGRVGELDPEEFVIRQGWLSGNQTADLFDQGSRLFGLFRSQKGDLHHDQNGQPSLKISVSPKSPPKHPRIGLRIFAKQGLLDGTKRLEIVPPISPNPASNAEAKQKDHDNDELARNFGLWRRL